MLNGPGAVMAEKKQAERQAAVERTRLAQEQPDHPRGDRGDERLLDEICAAIFIDAIMVKVHDGQVVNRSFYARSGEPCRGRRHPRARAGTDLCSRGVADVFFVVCG